MTLAKQQEFQALMHQHRKILYKICRGYCADAQDREDLAQDIVVQLWKSFASYDARAAFSTWMYRVALNVAVSSYRSSSRRRAHLVQQDETLLQVADDAAMPSDTIRAIQGIMDGLDKLSRALMLLYLEGYSAAECGQVIGITETNASTRISRIRQRIRAGLEHATTH
jgi:RNA polymerase sigma-70 factor (ECF subfamily)